MVDVKGYEGVYGITESGNVFSYRRKKFLKPISVRGGYSGVFLYENGKAKLMLIHRIVAESFIKNPYNFLQVNHKDENKLNNSVNNLEWCDAKYNSNYGTRNKRLALSRFNNQKFKGNEFLRNLRLNSSLSQVEVSKELGVTQAAISKWESGETKPLKKYHKKLAKLYGVTVDELLKGE